jgi:hypothetical protein
MIYYVLISPLLPIAVLVLSFLAMRLLTHRLQVSEIDAVGQLNLNTAFSLSSLAALSVLGYIDSDSWLTISMLYLAFYVTVAVAAMAWIDRPILVQKWQGLDVRLFADPRYQYIVATITGGILALSSLFFAYILVSQGLSGDDRIALAKDYRVLDVIRRGFASVFTYYSISCLLYRRDRYLLGLLVFNVGISFFSGSKGFFVEYLTAYITIDALIKGQSRSRYKKLLPLVGLLLILMVSTVMFWQNLSPLEALEAIGNRFFASGDIFYYAFLQNDYKDLYGEYNFWSYVFHPLTSLVGLRGYEWPIGSLLYAQAGTEIRGFGPNPQLPMTALILLQGNIWLALLFCIVMALVMVAGHRWAWQVLQRHSLPTVLRTSIFAVFFVKINAILVDFSLVMIDFIAIAAMTTLTLILQAVLDRRELVLARRAERIRVLAGLEGAPKPPLPPEEQLVVGTTRSKKLDQFEELVTTTILRSNKLKKLADLLNIATGFNKKP